VPQLFGSVCRSAHALPHSVSPFAHPHVPPEHTSVAVHAVAHELQWLGSV
jgi:hypothetical protein